MKQIYIFLVLTALSIYSAKAQTYKLIITKNDGTTIEMKTSEVEQMHFEEYTEEEPKVDTLSTEDIKKAQELLNGEIVLNSMVSMGNVNKTLLDTGCPTKFKFEWIDDQSFNLSLNNFFNGQYAYFSQVLHVRER